MISTRPYIVRAIYQWVIESDLTPYLLVDASQEGVEVPLEYVKEGKIVLNLAPTAISDLELDNEFVSFSARFSGVGRGIYVPIQGVLAVYAKETTKGVFFERDGDIEPPPNRPRLRDAEKKAPVDEKQKPEKPSFLKIVK